MRKKACKDSEFGADIHGIPVSKRMFQCGAYWRRCFFFSSISAVNASSTEFVLLDGVEHYQTDIEISNEGSLHVTETLRLHVTHKPLILKHLRSFTSGKLALAKVILNQQELPLAKQGWYQLSRLELDQQHALGQGHHVLVLDYHLPRYIDKKHAHSVRCYGMRLGLIGQDL